MKENTQQTNAYSIPLSVDDVVLMVNIINAVSRRGAFEASEMTTVGSLFERLKSRVEPRQESAPEPEQNKDQLELDFVVQ